MPSLKSRLLYYVVKRQLTKLRGKNLPLPEFRLAREVAATNLRNMPKRIKVETTHIGGCHAERLRPDNVTSPNVVLYLHGGAYTTGSCITHRALAARLALASGCATLVIDYRLAPEHPFPAGLDDALAVYEALRSNGTVQIALAGDSAGAGLALALVLRLRELGLPMPRALALMSPWTDLALTSETHQTKASVDPYFPNTDRIAGSARVYAGDQPLNHPLVSPYYADLHGLPPMLVHVGELETLINDSIWLVERVTSAGGVAQLKRWPGMWHVWQALGGKMREADESIAELGKFLQQALQSK